MLSDELNINRETVRKILIEDLSMKKICAKMVPKNLSEEQKHVRMTVAQDCLEQLENDPKLLEHVVAGDESWFFQYDPETKRQSQQWLSPASARPKKARMSKSKVKTMMICFFDSNKLVHKEFLPPGQTVNQQFYIELLERSRKRIIRVRPEIANTWILHHDNAPCHRAFSVMQFLTSKNITVLPQPPYSPDMSPYIQTSVTRVFQELPVNNFQKSYENWKKRWTQCVTAQGEYFEGDHIDVP
ncbi:hypothetical protein QTP88_010893 [Uroleucon formosanum]